MASTHVTAAVLTPELVQELAARQPGDLVPVIVQMADRVDHRSLEVRNRSLRDGRLVRALKDKADFTQKPLLAKLGRYGVVRWRQLWVVNGLAVTLPAWAIAELAQEPSIGRIQLDAVVTFSLPPASAPAAAGWNIDAIHAQAVWALGSNGAGVVVANMDTGVDNAHPELAGSFRGGANSWFDPYLQHATPYDFSGHGTQTMGLMVSGSASGTALGVAPQAKWIATKIFDDVGQGTFSGIHAAFQWLLDPDGNPATQDGPDVVNASWGLNGVPGVCNLEFNEDLSALAASAILVVSAAGNAGPSAGTSASPGDNPNGFAVGAVDQNLSVASQSSRGPGACDSAVFPRIAAPGINVVTTDLSFGGMPLYASVSGTSFAAPHVAGTIALLAAAFPAASVAQLKGAVIDAARDLGTTGADNDYGAGIIDAQAAYLLLQASLGTGTAPVITSTPPTVATEAQRYAYSVTATDAENAVLVYSLDIGPPGMTINAASGLIDWTPAHAQVGTQNVTVRVTDPTARFAQQAFTVTVAAVNHPPVAANDAYAATAGGTLIVNAPGVLGNDSDVDGNRLSATTTSNPMHGVLSLASDGSFTYTPAAGYVGADTFSYRASDGMANSAPAQVSITVTAAAVNKPPVANNDAVSVAVNRTLPLTTTVINVLANDRDSDGTLDNASVVLTSLPNQKGTATVNVDGSVRYTPRLRFTGTETFKYKVRDNRGAFSNVATVTVTVR